MLMYQLLTGSFPFWDSVQNISLQQVWQAILVKKVDLDAPKLQVLGLLLISYAPFLESAEGDRHFGLYLGRPGAKEEWTLMLIIL
jgi:hypothetical protein